MSRYALYVFLLSLILSASAFGQTRAIWQIGAFDKSAMEFGANSMPRAFVIGESQTKDWSGAQQAVTASKANEAGARKIDFTLPEAPHGIYKLRIGLIVKTARLPVVQVEINGHRGWFYQRFESYREGNEEGAILPQYATGELVAEIPTNFFVKAKTKLR